MTNGHIIFLSKNLEKGQKMATFWKVAKIIFIVAKKYEKWPKSSQFFKSGQMKFLVAKHSEKWPNFQILATKWPVWQPCSKLLLKIPSQIPSHPSEIPSQIPSRRKFLPKSWEGKDSGNPGLKDWIYPDLNFIKVVAT